jgi:hypothetical protein
MKFFIFNYSNNLCVQALVHEGGGRGGRRVSSPTTDLLPQPPTPSEAYSIQCPIVLYNWVSINCRIDSLFCSGFKIHDGNRDLPRARTYLRPVHSTPEAGFESSLRMKWGGRGLHLFAFTKSVFFIHIYNASFALRNYMYIYMNICSILWVSF